MFHRKGKSSRRLLQAFAKRKWHQRNVWKMADSGSSVVLFSLTSRQISLHIQFSDDNSQRKNILQFLILKKE